MLSSRNVPSLRRQGARIGDVLASVMPTAGEHFPLASVRPEAEPAPVALLFGTASGANRVIACRIIPKKRRIAHWAWDPSGWPRSTIVGA